MITRPSVHLICGHEFLTAEYDDRIRVSDLLVPYANAKREACEREDISRGQGFSCSGERR